uniref:TBC1 domain family member 20 n=1 Tax=Callorhinchus milii TaxID=7868 RepID=A0A4W3H6A4_CALMI
MSGRRGRRSSAGHHGAAAAALRDGKAATVDPGARKRLKLLEIHRALNADPVDVEALRRAAVSEGGLLTNEIRRKVWPKLLNVNVYNLPPKPGKAVRTNHKDYNQVLMDVKRSLSRFPQGMRVDQRVALQQQLIDVILYVLKGNPQLHYYQGYHDIAVTFLLVMGPRMAAALLQILSTHHLRDFMDNTMENTKHILNYLMAILEQVKPELHEFIQRAEVGTIFALSWLITWYGHVLSEFCHTVRLYDFFLASHPLMAIYFAAVVVLHREEAVLRCDCDMPSVHQLLSQIPQDLPYQALIQRAEELFSRYPPSQLAKLPALQHHKRQAHTLIISSSSHLFSNPSLRALAPPYLSDLLTPRSTTRCSVGFLRPPACPSSPPLHHRWPCLQPLRPEALELAPSIHPPCLLPRHLQIPPKDLPF